MAWLVRVEPYRGYSLVHHGGNLEGYSSIIGFVPAEKLGVVGPTNIGRLIPRRRSSTQAIDRALDLPDRDWNALPWPVRPDHRRHGQGQTDGRGGAHCGCFANACLDAYVGVYAADGYPDVAVRREARWPTGLAGHQHGLVDAAPLPL
ncbi:MAG: hypothetical protein IPK19_04580, partial [Chloroflexi bacterium]|nr:hypothetical protein [Chloroflexota bacterium]